MAFIGQMPVISLIVGSLVGLSACAMAVGAGVGAVAVTTAAVTAGCYDAVDVRVMDAVSGQKTCSAELSAVSRSGSTVRFASCYYAALPHGEWTLRAQQSGYDVATARVIVEQKSRCEPAVQTLELALHPSGEPRAPAVPSVSVTASPPAPAPPTVAPPVPTPSPAEPGASPPASGTPSPSPAPPSSAPASPSSSSPPPALSSSPPAPPPSPAPAPTQSAPTPPSKSFPPASAG